MKKSLAFLLSIPFLFFSLSSFLQTDVFSAGLPDISSSGYILIEKDDLHEISGYGEHLRLPPASTTKLMTCLVVLEHASPDETVTVSSLAASTEGSSAYLRGGEKLTVLDLLYCLMLASANDAATALAEHIAGDIPSFASLMNEKAEELGLRDTHFTNPHGLDDEDHYTSPYDLALIASAVLDHPLASKIVSSKRRTVGENESRRDLVNHNKLLFSLDGCIGMKTGYTIRSGRCLVSACKRNGTTLLCVTLGCHDDWTAHKALYEYGFARVRRQTVEDLTIVLPVADGTGRTLSLYANGFSFLADAEAHVECIFFCPRSILPPVKDGEVLGRVSVLLDGKEVQSLPLFAAEELQAEKKPGFFSRILLFILSLFK